MLLRQTWALWSQLYQLGLWRSKLQQHQHNPSLLLALPADPCTLVGAVLSLPHSLPGLRATTNLLQSINSCFFIIVFLLHQNIPNFLLLKCEIAYLSFFFFSVLRQSLWWREYQTSPLSFLQFLVGCFLVLHPAPPRPAPPRPARHHPIPSHALWLTLPHRRLVRFHNFLLFFKAIFLLHVVTT